MHMFASLCETTFLLYFYEVLGHKLVMYWLSLDGMSSKF